MDDPVLAPPAPDAPQAAPPEPPKSTVKPLSCPNCGGIVNVRAQGLTVSVLCEHCGSTLDATSPDLQVIARANEALKTPQIPLGTRGELRGRTWEVVGYMERTDEEVRWAEYLLFNPYEGYAFLVDDGRRFSLGVMLDRLPTMGWGNVMQVDGLSLSPFGTGYPVRVTFVVGEFYWRVAVGETVTETDYVRPGTMLACEDYAGERTWTRLDMLDWGVAEKAFGIANRRKEYSSPAPHEPSPYRSMMGESWIIGIIAAVTLFVISGMGAGESVVATTNADVQLDGPEKTLVIRNIDLPNARDRISVDADASTIDNAWVDIDYSLTDQKTQDSVDTYGLAEFYEGYDSDGRWTEGDPRPEVTMSSIPGGRYDLVVTLKASKWSGGSSSSSSSSTTSSSDIHSIFGDSSTSSFSALPTVPVTVTVKRGGIFGGNIILGLLVILIWPIIVMFKHLGFEKRRKAVLSSGSDDSDDSSDWSSDD